MTLSFRSERLVLSSAFAAELAAEGRAVTSLEHFPDGTAILATEPVEYAYENADHDDLCECLDCERQRQHWHAWACHDDEQFDCPDCADEDALIYQRARLIARLKGRMQTLGAVFVDDASIADPSEWRLLTPRSGGCEGCGLAFLGGCAPGRCAREASALLHPFGRCSCGGEGRCSWCKSTCPDCGGTPHGRDCPDFDEIAAQG